MKHKSKTSNDTLGLVFQLSANATTHEVCTTLRRSTNGKSHDHDPNSTSQGCIIKQSQKLTPRTAGPANHNGCHTQVIVFIGADFQQNCCRLLADVTNNTCYATLPRVYARAWMERHTANPSTPLLLQRCDTYAAGCLHGAPNHGLQHTRTHAHLKAQWVE